MKPFKEPIFCLAIILLLCIGCSTDTDDDTSTDTDNDDDSDPDCIACETTSECTNALGTKWVCQNKCCEQITNNDDDDDDILCYDAWTWFTSCGWVLEDQQGNPIDVADLITWCESGKDFYSDTGYTCLAENMGTCGEAGDCIRDTLENNYSEDNPVLGN